MLKWSHNRAAASPRALHKGKVYFPLPLNPSVRRALRLLSSCSGFVSTALLFRGVALVAKFTDLIKPFREHSISFASWLPDCLPGLIKVSLWFPTTALGLIFRFLSTFDRSIRARSKSLFFSFMYRSISLRSRGWLRFWQLKSCGVLLDYAQNERGAVAPEDEDPRDFEN